MSKYFLPATALLLLGGCSYVQRPSLPPASEDAKIPSATLNKTFGDVSVGRNGTLVLRYQALTAGLNLSSEPVELYDYLLFSSRSDAMGWASAGLEKSRNKKIIVPPGVEPALQKNGLSQVKGLKPKALLQLKKDQVFLFLRAMVHGEAGDLRSSYFLEFDNGRNIFLGDSSLTPDGVRQFVYDLRDEGKEVHMAFIPFRTSIESTAEIIGLLQPEVAVLTGANFDKNQEMSFAKNLNDQLFSGSLHLAHPGATFPF